jgi:hypothetical protein
MEPVAAIVPVLDEAEATGGVVAGFLAYGVDHVIVVDGNLKDDKVSRARSAGAVVVVEPRCGYGRAMMTGIASLPAGTRIVLFFDGDGSDRPETFYGARFTDMSPFRALRLEVLERLGMCETTFGWNLEMQMRVAALGLRVAEIPVGQRRRQGGVSKVSGDWSVALRAAWVIARTFARLAWGLRRATPTSKGAATNL